MHISVSEHTNPWLVCERTYVSIVALKPLEKRKIGRLLFFLFDTEWRLMDYVEADDKESKLWCTEGWSVSAPTHLGPPHSTAAALTIGMADMATGSMLSELLSTALCTDCESCQRRKCYTQSDSFSPIACLASIALPWISPMRSESRWE